MKCIFRYTTKAGKRVCQAMIVDERRKLIEKIEGMETDVRRSVELKYPGIAYHA